VDQSVSEFLDAYLAGGQADRAGASPLVGQDSSSAEMLTVYSGRMAAMTVRTESSHYLQLALAAMTLAPAADFQEFTWTLPILYDAAQRIGRDPQAVFAESASLGPAGKRVMEIFRWTPEQRRLKHDRPVMASDGFRYESVLQANSQ